MAVHGFATHAARNRRLTALFLALYGVVFVAFTLLILSPLPVIFGRTAQSIFVDPLAYLSDFWLVALAAPVLAFAWNRYTFARDMKDLLQVRTVTTQDEPRFAGIAGAQAILQGLRLPRLGVIESDAYNALTVGALAGKPRIVVTRGLLDRLDDDELAAVLAHEIAHWRLGDVRLLTVNQVMMRTAIALQAINPIKIERHPHHSIQWHLVAGIVMAPFLVALFVGGMFTMALWTLARFANRKVRAGRDTIADGEAIRITHFPEALESAMARCRDHGWFEHAERFEALMFEGATVDEGGTHPAHAERIAAMREHASELYMPGRTRRDTRDARPALRRQQGFGRRSEASGFTQANAARPDIEEWSVARGISFWTDPASHRDWRRQQLDWFTWRMEDRRDVFGVARDMRGWAYGSLAAACALAMVFAASPQQFLAEVSGASYISHADGHWAEFTCSLRATVQECDAEQAAREAKPVT